ncbi:hypothetical protein DFH09DRAFT_1070442 [Mycena vulgaris]|nr:hypothetical protein DFH09DRAFT_1070442 [Mycena vulgaris]
MPPQPITTEIRLNNIVKCFTIAVDSLEVLTKTFKSPFLEPIFNTAKSLLTAVQTVRQNKSDCAKLLEETYGLLCAIVSFHMKPEAGPDMSPSMLNDLGKFTDTLYKIHTFVEAQQDKSKIRQFFRQGEVNRLFKDCNLGLQEALDHFKVKGFGVSYLQDIKLLTEVVVMQKFAKDRHKEVLELIEAFSDGTASDKGSLTNRVLSSSYNCSTSISMLPSEPKIFHGREAEVADILKLFMQETPRIAILGGGGMGKTSLSRAVLHHPTIAGKYGQHRFFVAGDTASTKDELVTLIGAHLGLKPKKDLAKVIFHHFATNPTCLMILDNLETLWESTEIRRDIEELLSLLTDVKHLGLIITMRGTERPASVRWTRPFLPVLKPLTQDAVRQTFIDIADDCHNSDDIDKVLLLTGNMPLVIDLMAHLVESEGCPNVLARWEEEKTSVISDGYDKRSNLDLSILMSLSSPRITSVPHCQDLLSLLSMLPDGLSDIELVRSKLPIKDILSCKAALLSSSLAHCDDQRRLRVLVPIQEYMARSYPPTDHLVQSLLNYFHQLLEFSQKYSGTVSASEMTLQITSNFSNIQGLLLNRLQHQNPPAVETIYCTIYLNAFSRHAGRGRTPLMDQIGHTQSLPRFKTGSTGSPAAGQKYASEAQRLAKISADLYSEAHALSFETVCWHALGNYKYAAFLCDRARDLLVHCGMSGGDLDNNLMIAQAEIYKLKSEYVEARNIHRRLLHGSPIELDLHAHAAALLNIAELDVLLDVPKDDLQKNLYTAKSLFNSVGHLSCAVICDALAGALHLRERNLMPAKLLFYECLSFFGGNRADIVNYCLESLANRSLWDSEDWTSSWTVVYLGHASKSKHKLDVYKALQFLGDAFQAEGDLDTASSLLTVALEGFTQMDIHRSRAECMHRLGDISKQKGDTMMAMKLWKTARPLFERSSQTKQIALIDERLAGIILDGPENNERSLANLSHLHAPPGVLGDTTTVIENLILTDVNGDVALVSV